MEFFQIYIVWLMGWPAGLKLNGSMSRFLGTMHQWVIGLWASGLTEAAKYVESFILFTAIVAVCFGASAAVALVADAVQLCCNHITFCYFISTRIYSWELRVISSLFHLFRGKKWNVLRKRLDSAEYALDQLLLGTILFASLIFLLPTIATYYWLFAFSHIACLAIYTAADCLLDILHHAPVHELWTRKSRVSGIRVEFDAQAGVTMIKYRHPSHMSIIRPLLGVLIRRVTRLLNKSNIESFFAGAPLMRLGADNDLVGARLDQLPDRDAIKNAFAAVY